MAKPKSQDAGKYVRLDRELAREISSFLFALGNSFVNFQNPDAAFDCFKYSTDLDNKNHASVYNLGALYNITGNPEAAYRMFAEANRMRPDDITTKTAMAEVARKLGRLDESRRILEATYKIDPQNYLVMSAMSILYYDEGRLAEAMEWNDRALAAKPGDLHMMLNRTLINMTYGNWPEWWKHYEYCLSYQKNEKMKNLNMADAWGGQECEGKHLFVVSDQGSGDAIQFSRYLVEAKRLGKFAKLTYLVQPDLKEILSRVEGVDEVVGFGEKLSAGYDNFSSLLGIMRVLQISPKNCFRQPHLVTSEKLDEVWANRINEAWDGKSKRIGFVWAGDPKHGNDHARSIPLSQLLKIIHGSGQQTPVSGVQLFSFQVGPGMSQLTSAPIDPNVDIVELGSQFRSFDDTASALRQMDLLITCDTSVGHLAGGMGMPFWLLLPNPPEWRWMLDRGDSPWYKGVKIFRQPAPKDWDSVMQSVLIELQNLFPEAE